MSENLPSSNQPHGFDPVLEEQAPILKENATVTGLEAVKQQLTSNSLELGQAALSDALNYGKEGLQLVVEIVQTETDPLQWAAYDLLWERVSPATRKKLLSYKQQPVILIVDDSVTIRELTRLILERNGYRVKIARNGQEAWTQLSAGIDCDLVLCDSDMPKMDGYQLIMQIQSHPELSKLPTVFLDSKSSPVPPEWEQRLIEFQQQGRYLVKPWEDERLLEIVEQTHRFQRPEKNYSIN